MKKTNFPRRNEAGPILRNMIKVTDKEVKNISSSYKNKITDFMANFYKKIV